MRSKAYDGFQEPSGRLMDPPPMVPYKDERNLRSLKDIRSSLTAADLTKVIDLRPYINQGCYTVPEHASMTRVYMLFRGMGLRHLPVLAHGGELCGIITRKDSILAHDAEIPGQQSPSFVPISLP